MKTVFDNNEVCHVWAQQSQINGRSGSIFFEREIIYSYGYHFPMAKFYQDKKAGTLILFTSKSYSSTTGKHKGSAYSAISHYTVIDCPQVIIEGYGRGLYHTRKSHKINISYFFDSIIENLGYAKRARKDSIKEYRYEDVKNLLKNVKTYINYFKCKKLLSKKQKDILNSDNIEMDKVLNDVLQDKEKREAREKASILKHKKKQLKKWLNNEHFSGSLIGLPLFLRLSQDKTEVETSLGARVPVREASILYKMIKSGKDVKGHKIGYYTVIANNGVLKIGCHNIPKKEVDRFAGLMNW